MVFFCTNWKLISWVVYFTTALSAGKGERVSREIQELLDMVPKDRVVNVCMRYALKDSQVKAFLSYANTDQFKQNMADLESSEEFEELATIADTYNIDIYAFTNKLNSILDMFPVSDENIDVKPPDDASKDSERDTHEEGIIGVMNEIVEIIPMAEIKQAYRYKLRTNPQFQLFEQSLMKQMLNGEIRSYLQPVIQSKPFQDTLRDLALIGLPLQQIKQFIQKTFIDFFDLDTSIETEVEELLEMVPYDKLLEICIEYAINDVQVKGLLSYLCDDHFKQSVAELKSSDEFHNLARAARAVHIDAYVLANKFISALNALPKKENLQDPRLRRRSPGEGLPGLVREAIEITPLQDMKKAYRYKLEKNPQLKMFEQSMMDRILSGEARQYVEPLINSKPFQGIKKDLEEMGLPLEQIQEFIELKLIDFFDLNKSEVQSTTDNAENITVF